MKARTTIVVLLLTALALFSQASFADARSGGGGTTTDVVVDSATLWATLSNETFTTTTPSNCIAVCCSDIANPGGTVNSQMFYDLTLATTGGATNGVATRVIELLNQANVNDPDSDAICTTRLFANIAAGAHSIRCLGRKVEAADLTFTVQDTSVTVGCFNGSQL